MMDPNTLIDATQSTGVPAPIWFVEFFKVLGLTLHMIPMGLWFAGLFVAILLGIRGGEHGKRFSERLWTQMPIGVALGVNLGVVPLLFTQVAYNKVFYPATILMAWAWMAVVALVIPAYYGVYAYSWGLREAGSADAMPAWRRAGGWMAAVLFIAVGFLFTNAFFLMSHVELWPQLWLDHSKGGAALGTVVHVPAAAVIPRWLLMFGLGITTTAAWIVVDAAWFAGKESSAYREWAAGFAPKLAFGGVVWFAIAGTWYMTAGATWGTLFVWPVMISSVAAAVGPGIPFGLMVVLRKTLTTRATATLIGLAQVAALGANATSRQILQNLLLSDSFDALRQPTNVEWSPLLVFLAAFVVNVGIVVWMIQQVAKHAESEPA